MNLEEFVEEGMKLAQLSDECLSKLMDYLEKEKDRLEKQIAGEVKP